MDDDLVDHEPVQVTCYSGYRYAQEPRAFVWRGERHSVTAVDRTWRTPSGFHFVVGTAGGARFELAYDELTDAWRLNRVGLLQSTARNIDEEVKRNA